MPTVSRQELNMRGYYGCFAGSTKILSPEGKEGYLEIKDIEIGQHIYSWNIEKQKLIERPVLYVVDHGVAPVVELFYNAVHDYNQNIGPIRLTRSHSLLTPFVAVQERDEWQRVRDLITHDLIYVVSGNAPDLLNVVFIKRMNHITEPERVYNLITKGEHNFIADGLIASNFSVLREARTVAYRAAERAVDFLTLQNAPMALTQG
jgi:hypothetical protein